MIEALATGSAPGVVAGLAPDPFLAFVAATSVEHGSRAGFRVALAPFAVETPVMLLSVLVLASIPDATLKWIGLVGGVVIAGLGGSFSPGRPGLRGGREHPAAGEGSRAVNGTRRRAGCPGSRSTWRRPGARSGEGEV